ncbi:hypothetical protein ALC56_14693, partial [Trachymyrmex septentrionalis]
VSKGEEQAGRDYGQYNVPRGTRAFSDELSGSRSGGPLREPAGEKEKGREKKRYLLRMRLLTHKESCVQPVKSGFTGIVPTMVPLGSPSLISSWTRVSTALLCIARPIAAVLSCGNIGDLRGTNRCIREETSPGRGGSDPPRAAPRETRVCGCSRMLRGRESGTF